jgi:hypothetical protein
MTERFIPRHGGYERLISFQKARIVYDGKALGKERDERDQKDENDEKDEACLWFVVSLWSLVSLRSFSLVSILNSLKSSRLELVAWKAAIRCLFDAHPDTVLCSEPMNQCARGLLKGGRRFDFDR